MLGPVYRAYQPDPGRLVAVKQFKLDLPPETAHRFVAELDRLIAAGVAHPGAASFLSAGLTDATPYLGMDFVAAESFDVVIRDYGPSPVVDGLRIASQLAAALDHAAEAGVFHGALHPRDVLVSPDETRVTGLGIAQALDAVGLIPPVRRPYTAPERVAGHAWDRRADGFSLAALLFEVLFGRRITGVGAQAAEAATRIDGASLDGLKTLFRTALAERPDERFATASAFAAALHTELIAVDTGKSRGRRKRVESDPAVPARVIPGRTGRMSLPLDDEPGVEVIPPRPKSFAAPSIGPEAASVDAASAPELVSTVPAAPIEAVSAASEPDADEPVIDFSLPAGFTDRMRSSEAADEAPELAMAERATVDAIEAHLPLLDEGGDLSVPLTELRLMSDGRKRIASIDEHDIPLRAARDRRRSPVADSGRGDERPIGLGTADVSGTRWGVWAAAAAVLLSLGVGYTFGYQRGLRQQTGLVLGTSQVQSAPASAEAARPSVAQAANAPEAQLPTPAPAVAAQAPAAPSAPTDVAATAASALAAAAQQPAPVDAPAARAASEPTQLVLNSTPSGARVTVDGRDVGVTPVAVGSLRRGAHTVRFAHQGYVTTQRRVRIRSAQPAQSIEVTLAATRSTRPATSSATAAQASGSLTVDSRPAGARVFVDGKQMGTTPLQVGTVQAGEHAVRLERDGYRPWSRSVRVPGGGTSRVSGSLRR